MDVVKGEEVTFMCKIEGEPEPTVTWQHDRKPVTVSPTSKCLEFLSEKTTVFVISLFSITI